MVGTQDARVEAHQLYRWSMLRIQQKTSYMWYLWLLNNFGGLKPRDCPVATLRYGVDIMIVQTNIKDCKNIMTKQGIHIFTKRLLC